MKKQKILSIFVVLALMASSIVAFVPSVSASEELIISQGATPNNYQYIRTVHPSNQTTLVSSTINKVTVATDTYLTAITLTMYKTGTPNAVLRAFLLDTDKVLIELSTDTIAASTLGTGTSGVAFNFTFSGTSLLGTQTDYYLGVFAESAILLDASNDVRVRRLGSGTDINYAYYNSKWNAVASSSLTLLGYGDITISPTPTPTPTPTGGGGTPIGTAQLTVDAYADCNVSWHVQGSTTNFYEGVYNLPVGTVIEMTCVPDEGYYFYYWWAIWGDGSTQFSLNPLHFTLYEDLSLTAFVDAADLAVLQTITLQEGSGGRVYADYTPENWTGAIRFFAGIYEIGYNSSLTVGGLPNTNYQFYRTTLAWNIGGVALSSTEYNNPVTVSVIGSLTAKAYFTAGSLYPTVSPGGEGDTLGTVLTLLTSQAMISLFIMVIVGFVCYLMAGAWGFFAGVNVAAIMLLLAGALELWAIIILVIVDALLLYGKISASKSSPNYTGE